jgi:hypothetical protein
MALTAYGRNEGLNGATAVMTWLGLFSAASYAPTSNTKTTESLLNLTGAKAKGFTNGAIVWFTELTGSVTGIVAGRPYYVVGEVTNGFEVALEEGGAAIKVTGHELETGSTKVALLTELSGGGYKRIKTTWGTAKLDEISDTAAEVIKVPAGKEIVFAGWWEGESTGKLTNVAKLEVAETYGLEGEYKVTSDKLEAPMSLA